MRQVSHGPTSVERVEKPWGHELIWVHTDRYAGKILHINAGEALSYQYHESKTETVYVLRGTLILHVSEDDNPPRVETLVQGQAFHITPGLRHRFEAHEDVELIEVSTPELGDVVRLSDRYDRVPE